MFRLHRSSYLQLLFAFVVIVAGIVLFYRLGDPPLKNWDESIYAEVAKEILQTGDWLTLRWQRADWLEKPPLTFWIMASFFRLFAVNEFWARAVSALAGVGVVAVIYQIGRLHRGPVCGLISALVLLTTFQFVQMSRLVNTDVLLVFFVYLAIYGYLRVRNGDGRWWYLVSVSCALAFMVKSFGSLFAPAAIALALIVDRQVTETLLQYSERSDPSLRSRYGSLLVGATSVVKERHFWLSILAGLAIVVPWHVTMIYLHGSAFVHEYFYYHVWSRTFTSLEGHRAYYLFYVNEIWFKTHPWWSIAPFALIFNLWEIKRRRISIVVLALMLMVFGFYTAAQTKSHAYILPVYPGLALVIGNLFAWLWERRSLVVRVAIVLVLAWSADEAIGKIRAYYVKIEDVDVAVKELAHLAGAQTSPPVLIVYSQTREFDPQGALFYSGKRVLQATGGNPVFPYTGTLYHRSKPLSELVTNEPAGIILRKDEIDPLRTTYTIDILGESHELAYGTIRKK